MYVPVLVRLIGINRSDARDSDMEMMRDTIVESLFALFVTLGKALLFSSRLSCIVLLDHCAYDCVLHDSIMFSVMSACFCEWFFFLKLSQGQAK